MFGPVVTVTPCDDEAQAVEIASLAGGAEQLAARAREKLEAGDLALACHLADWAVMAAPEDKEAHAARVRVYQARADDSLSTMSHGIYRAAVLESAQKAAITPPTDVRSM